jgi:effector-binding domain-containing protein
VSHTGPYQELGPVYGRLFAWMEQKQVKANGFIREIGYDNPMQTPPEKCRQEICVPVGDGVQSAAGIEVKTLPQVEVISVVHRGSLDFQSLGPAYNALMQWAGANGKKTQYSIVTYYTPPQNREKAEIEIAMVIA